MTHLAHASSKEESTSTEYMYVVIGGGIAGVTCAETLSSLQPESSVLLISASPLIKAVTNFKMVTNRIEDFDVEERALSELSAVCSNVTVIHDAMTDLDTPNKVVYTKSKRQYRYSKLCLCLGGSPNIIEENNPFVVGIRDTETVQTFQKKLSSAKRILVVGNGGIATELVYEVDGCEVIWVIKDASISNTFVDAGAAEFFTSRLNGSKETTKIFHKRMRYTQNDKIDSQAEGSYLGGALGPDWAESLEIKGSTELRHKVIVEKCCEVKSILSPEYVSSNNLKVTDCGLSDNVSSTKLSDTWPVYVLLTNGKLYGCDLIVSATGVLPNTSLLKQHNQFTLASDGGVLVNDQMQTSVSDVYAAGDVCTCGWTPAAHWKQMRLWSQARQMGAYSAKCMVSAQQSLTAPLDFCFELFTHVTKFFGYKVILLGKYNAEGLGSDFELLLRVTKNVEFVKAVMQNGKMQGAILIGETDLEETFENLILNGIDLSLLGEDLLNPDIDIEDYFD